MKLQKRINLLTALGEYLSAGNDGWKDCVERAFGENAWFTPDFTQTAADHIVHSMLQPGVLNEFAARYALPEENTHPKTVGIVMAGNIPFAGFHDLLCGFLCGHNLLMKLPEKATVITDYIVQFLMTQDSGANLHTATQLKNCDAYIATGSNNTSRYFEYYFGKYANIIRHNRTAIAILDGSETAGELEGLADDVHLYYGRGCRNVTKLYVPKEYDFVPMLNAFSKYDHFKDHNKYRNNYDYQLSLLILNKRYYMTNGTVLLTENSGLFSPVSQVFYEYYEGSNDPAVLAPGATNDLQCVVNHAHTPFGQAQFPAIDDFADGADTMAFLEGLGTRD